jgi:hypothetical protein
MMMHSLRHQRPADGDALLLAPLRVPASGLSVPQHGKEAVDALREVRKDGRARGCRRPAEVFHHGKAGKQPPAFRHGDDAPVHDQLGVKVRDGLPLEMTSPLAERTSPEMVFSRVVLPAPLPPQGHDRPFFHLERAPQSAWISP